VADLFSIHPPRGPFQVKSVVGGDVRCTTALPPWRLSSTQATEGSLPANKSGLHQLTFERPARRVLKARILLKADVSEFSRPTLMTISNRGLRASAMMQTAANDIPNQRAQLEPPGSPRRQPKRERYSIYRRRRQFLARASRPCAARRGFLLCRTTSAIAAATSSAYAGWSLVLPSQNIG
jgi:hypothetical protein